jgi:hypothetical protein
MAPLTLGEDGCGAAAPPGIEMQVLVAVPEGLALELVRPDIFA